MDINRFNRKKTEKRDNAEGQKRAGNRGGGCTEFSTRAATRVLLLACIGTPRCSDCRLFIYLCRPLTLENSLSTLSIFRAHHLLRYAYGWWKDKTVSLSNRSALLPLIRVFFNIEVLRGDHFARSARNLFGCQF